MSTKIIAVFPFMLTPASYATDNGLTAVPCEPLTATEEAIIAFKATEPSFSGEYVNIHDDGVYHCRRCGRPLFESQHKFDSGSG